MSEQAKRRGSGRPRTTVLTRELILSTALRLLDERGEDGAGMRDIARELGVRPSALYNHISGQDDLIAGIRELVSDRIDVSGFGVLPWDAAVAQWARSYRDAFARHPPTIALLAVRPLAGATRTNEMYDAVCAGLVDAGWPESEVLTVVVALENFILGAALDHTAPDDMFDLSEEVAGEMSADEPSAAEPAASEARDFPHFTSAYESRAAALNGSRPTDLAFELGLEALLVGLRSRYSAR